MESAQNHRSPYGRPLEVNEIDHIIRCYGGRTIALEMEPGQMRKSKRSEKPAQYIDFLNHRNGELRLEATFYRECFKHAEQFKGKVSQLAQELLHECIIGLLDDTAFEEIRNIAKSVSDALDELQKNQKKAFDAFIAPYESESNVPESSLHSSMI